MSAGDEIITHSVVIGVVLAFVAIGSLVTYSSTSYALQKIRDAPSVHVSDLRSLLDGCGGGGERLVVVRGVIEAKSAIKGSYSNFWPDILVSKDSGYRAVIIQTSQKFLFNNPILDSKEVVASALRGQETTLTREVPFILVDSREQPLSDYVVVDLVGSRHPLPLTTVYRKMRPLPAPLVILQEGEREHEYPVCVVDEEKVLPVGKLVTAVGVCSSKDGVTRIKSCRDLPYFLCEKTQNQMITDLSSKSKICLIILHTCGIIVVSLSIVVLGYAIKRKCKQWLESGKEAGKDPRRQQQTVFLEDEDLGEVPFD